MNLWWWRVRRRLRRRLCQHEPTAERCECCGKPVQCERCGAWDREMDDRAYGRFLARAK